MVRKKSYLWEYFSVHDKDKSIAQCNICDRRLSYRGALSNLKKHLVVKHRKTLTHRSSATDVSSATASAVCSLIGDVYGQDYLDHIYSSAHFVEYQSHDTPTVIRTYSAKIRTVNLVDRRTSYLWEYFSINDKDKSIAHCNICDRKLSYRSTISNLRKHLVGKHPNTLTHRPSSTDVSSATSSAVRSLIDDVYGQDHLDHVYSSAPVEYQSHDPPNVIRTYSAKIGTVRVVHRRTSYLWEYFSINDNDKSIAHCNICDRKLSYRSTISNLRKHLVGKHPNTLTHRPSATDVSSATSSAVCSLIDDVYRQDHLDLVYSSVPVEFQSHDPPKDAANESEANTYAPVVADSGTMPPVSTPHASLSPIPVVAYTVTIPPVPTSHATLSSAGSKIKWPESRTDEDATNESSTNTYTLVVADNGMMPPVSTSHASLSSVPVVANTVTIPSVSTSCATLSSVGSRIQWQGSKNDEDATNESATNTYTLVVADNGTTPLVSLSHASLSSVPVVANTVTIPSVSTSCATLSSVGSKIQWQGSKNDEDAINESETNTYAPVVADNGTMPPVSTSHASLSSVPEVANTATIPQVSTSRATLSSVGSKRKWQESKNNEATTNESEANTYALVVADNVTTPPVSTSHASLSSVPVVADTGTTPPVSTSCTALSSVSSKRKWQESKNGEVIMVAQKQLSLPLKGNDEFDLFAMRIAAKMRKVSKINSIQCIIAERLISEVLYYAQLQSLTYDTVIQDSKNRVH